ncbi:unnamed protein product [Colias eurytheme]|nr:unnamed protein product [Colias eurytheme]
MQNISLTKTTPNMVWEYCYGPSCPPDNYGRGPWGRRGPPPYFDAHQYDSRDWCGPSWFNWDCDRNFHEGRRGPSGRSGRDSDRRPEGWRNSSWMNRDIERCRPESWWGSWWMWDKDCWGFDYCGTSRPEGWKGPSKLRKRDGRSYCAESECESDGWRGPWCYWRNETGEHRRPRRNKRDNDPDDRPEGWKGPPWWFWMCDESAPKENSGHEWKMYCKENETDKK